MRVMSAKAKNFGSYKTLEFDFTNQGLTMLSGATGAGKSTLCDLIPWGLFGKTAKGGTVDEILSWNADAPTEVRIVLQLSNKESVEITRRRGKPKDNDLYYSRYDHNIYAPKDIIPNARGKDIPDTQRLINQFLGMDYDLYLAGAYYHEFSQTAEFFTTTAKNRRSICEQLVDLSLPKKLQERLTLEYKEATQGKKLLELGISKIETALETLKAVQRSENSKREAWQIATDQAKHYALQNLEKFESNRKKMISKKCPSCNTVLVKPHTHIDISINPYIARLEELEAAVNPHSESVKDYSADIETKAGELAALQGTLVAYETEFLDIELLQEVSASYRSVTISNTIKTIEDSTNRLLSDHFDGEIRVSFEVADADKLNVSIYKDGNTASFTQLSKGQRCMLKLCFGISVMQAVQNYHDITFSQAFFDESLDGLSDALKVRAVRMFETLRHYESVFVVEHSETLKAMIPNQFAVELTAEGSRIEKI